jgi:PHS family inorganic phosphate transporter-like MFS transporter
VYFVAMSGFLADSYAIFSPNVVSPALAYIYWSTDITGTKGLVINVITLAGSCIGMVLFGWLADVFGRKRLYGVELVIGIIATLGLTQVSAGYNQQSMSPFAWIVWWRFILGIGIGAEYPLSALIAAEWSATSTRFV